MKTAWILSDCEPLPCDDNPRLMRAGQLAKYLSEHDWNVIWWVPGFNHGTKKDRFDSTKQIKVNDHESLIALHSPIVYKKNTSLYRVLFYKFLVRELTESFIEEQKPDVILCSWPAQSFAKAAIKYGKEHGVPVILDVRDLWPDIFTRAFPDKLRGIGRVVLIPLIKESERLFKSADSITSVTPSSLRWGLRKAGKTQGEYDRVVYIGYEDKILPDAEIQEEIENWGKQGITADTFNFTYFGTFSSSTLDLKTVIKAFDHISKDNRSIRLILCGNGDALQDFKRTAGNNKQILFPGWCSDTQIQSLLRISNVGLYPFKNLEDFRDAFGNKIIGYMAAGLPVMTSLEGFAKTYIEEFGFGRVYHEGEEASCARILHNFISNPEENIQMGKRAQERFKEDFNMRAVNSQFEALLSSLIENNTRE